MDKLQRNYILTVEDIDYNNVIITMPLTIEFDVNRDPGSAICSARITIYNLNPTTRKSLYKDGYSAQINRKCELRAGYGQTDLPVIFVGNIARCYSLRQGVNHLTFIEIYAGQYEIQHGFTATTFKEGTSHQQALDTVASDLMSKNIKNKVIGNFPGALGRDQSVSGNTKDFLMERSNDGFFVDNDTVYVINQNEYIVGEIAEIDITGGLLQSPRREGPWLVLDIIFEPRLKMAQIIKLTSVTEPDLSGTYKVTAIRHAGMISDAVCGQLITTVTLWFGDRAWRMIQ